MSNKIFLKDFSWYFLGSFLPLIIGFIKTPIFTRHFDKESFGYFGLVTITFSYFGMLLFSWIASCIWRFYNKYKDEKNIKTLYSNLFFLFLIAVTILAIITSVWYVITEENILKQLIFYSFIHLIFNQLFLFYMVIVRLKGKSNFYTIAHSLRSLLGLITALILVFLYQFNIAALIISLAIIDVLVVLILILINPVSVKISYNTLNKINLRELLNYGLAGLIINIGFLIIATSDRYIIAWFTNIENVGIYDQIYKISQLSILALITIYFNTINPILLHKLEINYNESIKLIRKYIKAVFLFGLPVVFYFSLFSKDISNVLLGEEFRSGYTIMPFVFFAAYLHGLSNFYELRFKFSNKLKRLSIIVISMALLNVFLTLFFVKFYGYKSAAITTTIVYLLLIVVFHFYDKKILKTNEEQRKKIIKIVFTLILQAVVFMIINHQFNLALFHNIFLGVFFIIIYYLMFKRELLTINIPTS